MRIVIKIMLGLFTTLLGLSVALASFPNLDRNPNTFLGPTLKGRFSSPISYDTAFSVFGEAGLKNLRAGGTVGWQMFANQRLKFSADFLRQEITYPFFTGNSDQWVNQGTISAAYQYDLFNCIYWPEVNLAAYYSHAPSKNLSTVPGFFFDQFGQIITFVNNRRIAGSDAWGLVPGISVRPWCGGKFGVDLNYDHVDYDKKYSPSQDAIGLGGTVYLNQWLGNTVNVGLAAAFRKPYTNYSASLTWANVPCFGNWAFGVDGNYTVGKNTLPDTYNVGLTVDYFIDPCPRPCLNLKGETKNFAQDTRFLSWTADPAFAHPQVLAIPDERVVNVAPRGCSDGTAPVVIATLPTVIIPSGAQEIVNAGAAFNGNNLIFSVTTTPTPPPFGSTVVIDPITGVVTITAGATEVPTTFTVTVTATNACGAASTTFPVSVVVSPE